MALHLPTVAVILSVTALVLTLLHIGGYVG